MGYLIKPIDMSEETKEKMRRQAIANGLEAMKKRKLKRLNKLHVYAHRRFHEATKAVYWRYWLNVRTKIQNLISEVSYDIRKT